MQYDDDDDELNPDAHSQTSQPIPQDLGKLPKEALLQLIAKERAVHVREHHCSMAPTRPRRGSRVMNVP